MHCPISIHALREEGDRTWSGWFPAGSYFYPRPPRGGRRPCKLSPQPGRQFLSTPSARRATASGPRPCPADHISIHALREEGDHFRPRLVLLCFAFLSTPSARRATSPPAHAQASSGISIHALREEGDFANGGFTDGSKEFLSTPSARRATYRTQDPH